MNPSSYELLKEINSQVTDLRKEIAETTTKLDDRVTILEHYQSNLAGKIGVGVLVVGTAVSAVMTVILEWARRRIA